MKNKIEQIIEEWTPKVWDYVVRLDVIDSSLKYEKLHSIRIFKNWRKDYNWLYWENIRKPTEQELNKYFR